MRTRRWIAGPAALALLATVPIVVGTDTADAAGETWVGTVRFEWDAGQAGCTGGGSTTYELTEVAPTTIDPSAFGTTTIHCELAGQAQPPGSGNGNGNGNGKGKADPPGQTNKAQVWVDDVSYEGSAAPLACSGADCAAVSFGPLSAGGSGWTVDTMRFSIPGRWTEVPGAGVSVGTIAAVADAIEIPMLGSRNGPEAGVLSGTTVVSDAWTHPDDAGWGTSESCCGTVQPVGPLTATWHLTRLECSPDLTGDFDADGVADCAESEISLTDPTVLDTDGDGIDDQTETNGGAHVDTDGDGTVDGSDADSDADGKTDADEGTGDADADGIPNYRDGDDSPTVIPGAAAVVEQPGGVLVDVPVKLAFASPVAVEVGWATIDTATGPVAGEDYVSESGVVTFAPGTTTGHAQITILDDCIDEPGQLWGADWLGVRLENRTHARIDPAHDRGLVIIGDNDASVTVVPKAAAVYEGDVGTVTMKIPVQLSAPANPGCPVTATWTTHDNSVGPTAGDDYVSASGQVTFAPGTSKRTVPITVIGDTIVEPGQLWGADWLGVAFSDGVNAEIGGYLGLGFGLIVDDD